MANYKYRRPLGGALKPDEDAAATVRPIAIRELYNIPPDCKSSKCRVMCGWPCMRTSANLASAKFEASMNDNIVITNAADIELHTHDHSANSCVISLKKWVANMG